MEAGEAFLIELRKNGEKISESMKKLEKIQFSVLLPFCKHPQIEQFGNKRTRLLERFESQSWAKEVATGPVPGESIEYVVNLRLRLAEEMEKVYKWALRFVVEDASNTYEFLLTAILDILKKRQEKEILRITLGIKSVELIQKGIEKIEKIEKTGDIGLEYFVEIQNAVVFPFLMHPSHGQWIERHNKLFEELEPIKKRFDTRREYLANCVSQIKSIEDAANLSFQGLENEAAFLYGLLQITTEDIYNTYQFLQTVILDIFKEGSEG